MWSIAGSLQLPRMSITNSSTWLRRCGLQLRQHRSVVVQSCRRQLCLRAGSRACALGLCQRLCSRTCCGQAVLEHSHLTVAGSFASLAAYSSLCCAAAMPCTSMRRQQHTSSSFPATECCKASIALLSMHGPEQLASAASSAIFAPSWVVTVSRAACSSHGVIAYVTSGGRRVKQGG